MLQQKQGRNTHLPGFEDQKLVPVGQIAYDLSLDGIRLENRLLGDLGSDLVAVRGSTLPLADPLLVFAVHGTLYIRTKKEHQMGKHSSSGPSGSI